MPLSDNELRTLFHQVEAPPMQADPVRVVAGGKARVHRRRVVAASLGAAGVALLAGSVALAQGLSPDAVRPAPVGGTTQQGTPSPSSSAPPAVTHTPDEEESPVPLGPRESYLPMSSFTAEEREMELPHIVVRQEQPGGVIRADRLDKQADGWTRVPLAGQETAVSGAYFFSLDGGGMLVVEQPAGASVVTLSPMDGSGGSTVDKPVLDDGTVLTIQRGTHWTSAEQLLDVIVAPQGGTPFSARGAELMTGGVPGLTLVYHPWARQLVRIQGDESSASGVHGVSGLGAVSQWTPGEATSDVVDEAVLPADAFDIAHSLVSGADQTLFAVLDLPDGLGRWVVASGRVPKPPKPMDTRLIETLTYRDGQGVRHTVERSGPQS